MYHYSVLRVIIVPHTPCGCMIRYVFYVHTPYIEVHMI